MKKVKIYQVDSFTDKLFCGNPAGVVFNAEVLNNQEMKQIAREMNLSETSFILPSDKAHLRLRFFTPIGAESKLCGHAILGTLAALVNEKMFGMNKAGNYLLKIETNIGVLVVTVNLENEKVPQFILELPKVKLVEAPLSLDEFLLCLGISSDHIDLTKPLMMDETQGYFYLTSKSLDDLGNINYDLHKAMYFTKIHNILLFCILTPFAFNPINHIHARGFGPLVGILEDPFTGSMQGGLAAYLLQNQMINKNLNEIGSEQGHFIGRPGQTTIELIHGTNFKVKLHARAMVVFSGEITI